MKARSIAEALAAQMRPYCRRLEIAGSIRRGAAEVKDIEIVAVPAWEKAESVTNRLSLFGEGNEVRANMLHRWALAQSAVRWIKPGTAEVVDWTPKPEGRYWRGLVRDSIKLDLFLATRDNFGLILAVRTGCAEFSQGLVTYAKLRTPYRAEGGFLRDRRGNELETREEADVFNLLGLEYVEPTYRTGVDAVRRKR